MSSAPETPPATPPEAEAERSFAAGDERWLARVAGDGRGGTGVIGTARFAVVHFVREGERFPRFSALLPAGRFGHLYDSELVELLRAARPLPPPGP